HHDNPQALRLFGMELAPAATCMAPGITGGGSGRPNPSPCLVHFSCLVPKGVVFAYLRAGNDAVVKTIQFEGPTNNDIPLIRLAWGRSGDKGDTCNIGIISREQKYYPLLKKTLTEKEVKYYMTHLCKGIVKRYELPGCNGLNF
ncbi:18868_t:CDS:2, partial [Funneliformis geosporum]